MLDHLGTPAGLFGKVSKATGKTEQDRTQIFADWKDQLAELAECKNVSTKMSGLFMPVLGHDFHTQKRLASKQELVERAAPVIQHTLDCFVSGRVMFASNFPMDSVSSSLTNIIDAFSDIVQDYNENALKPIFYENAKRFYRL